MDLFLGILFEIEAILIIFLCRNDMIARYRHQALMLTCKKADRAIDQSKNWWLCFAKLEAYGSHTGMLFSVWKWEFNSFYPGL